MVIVRRFAKSDVIVLLFSVLLLLNLAAAGTLGRMRAKQAVCLAHLKQMTHAWLSYAQDNDGKIVNGVAGITTFAKDRLVKPWVGKCWDQYMGTKQLPQEAQERAIEDGTLWPYVREMRLYRCPDGHPGEMLNYSIVDSMNGMTRTGTAVGNPLSLGATGVRIGDTVLWVRNLNEIISPAPAERMVFIDQGLSLPDSFSIHYRAETWWDPVPVQHWDGTSVTFADGHCEHWRWNGAETILNGRGRGLGQLVFGYEPSTPEDKDDLHRFQIAVWGRLGYEPTK